MTEVPTQTKSLPEWKAEDPASAKACLSKRDGQGQVVKLVVTLEDTNSTAIFRDP
jgi:hypothetical protein